MTRYVPAWGAQWTPPTPLVRTRGGHRFKPKKIFTGDDRNNKLEEELKIIAVECDELIQLHESTASLYKRMSTLCGLVILLSSTFLSIESLLPSDTTNIGVVNARKTLSIVITITAALLRFFNLDEIAAKHIATTDSYNKIYLDTIDTMGKEDKDKVDLFKIVQFINSQFRKVKTNSPRVNLYAVLCWRLEKTFMKIVLGKNDAIDASQTITSVIIKDQNEKKFRAPGEKNGENDQHVIDITDKALVTNDADVLEDVLTDGDNDDNERFQVKKKQNT